MNNPICRIITNRKPTSYNMREEDAPHYICRGRFMARKLYEEGACHDFVRQYVIRHARRRQSILKLR